jgi:hypothetical protein
VPAIAIGDPADAVHGTVRIFPIELKGDPKRAAGANPKEDRGAVLAGEKDFEGVGQSLATIGDLDGDGVDEIAVGWSAGKLGGILLLSGKDLSPARTIEYEIVDGRLPLGYRVAAGQDVDGDGRPDVAVARYWPTAGPSGGRSIAVSGGDGKGSASSSPEPAAPRKKPAERRGSDDPRLPRGDAAPSRVRARASGPTGSAARSLPAPPRRAGDRARARLSRKVPPTHRSSAIRARRGARLAVPLDDAFDLRFFLDSLGLSA